MTAVVVPRSSRNGVMRSFVHRHQPDIYFVSAYSPSAFAHLSGIARLS